MPICALLEAHLRVAATLFGWPTREICLYKLRFMVTDSGENEPTMVIRLVGGDLTKPTVSGQPGRM
jgi:hypothetical protein